MQRVRMVFQRLMVLAMVSALFLTIVPSTSAVVVEVLDQSQESENRWRDLHFTYPYVGQIFTAGQTGTLTKAKFFLTTKEFTSGTLVFQIRTVDTTTGIPTTTILASGSTTSFPVGHTDRDWVTVTFPEPASVTSGTQYALVVRAVGDSFDGMNFATWEETATNQAWQSTDGATWDFFNYASSVPIFSTFKYQTYVTVDDVTGPVISTPGNLTFEPTSINGAIATYDEPTANDAVFGATDVNCSHHSGERFPIGTTTVSCDATDNVGNSSEITFTIEVRQIVPPTVTPQVSGTTGDNGWYTSDVSVSWDVQGADSTTGCDTTQITTDTASTTLTCEASRLSVPTTESVTIKRDTTGPVISFSGNRGAYRMTDTVSITCAASDALSGLATDSCVNINAPASTFAAGNNTITATATDQAGNTTTVQTSFVVSGGYDGLIYLTRQSFNNRLVGLAASSVLSKAERQDARGNQTAEAVLLANYRLTVTLYERFGQISHENAEMLIRWSRTL